MNYRFDANTSRSNRICVEYLLVRRLKGLKENGVQKDFEYVAVVGSREYLNSKSLKMVYIEERDPALNLIINSLSLKGSSIVAVTDKFFNIDCDRKLQNDNIKIVIFTDMSKLCEHIK